MPVQTTSKNFLFPDGCQVLVKETGAGSYTDLGAINSQVSNTINFELWCVEGGTGIHNVRFDKIKKLYSDGKQNYLDGITVEYDNWWFNVRPSNTEPLIRLTIEANTKELLEEKKKELIALIKKEK